jgi:branched-chain amino acid transport system permease protein
VNFAHGAFYMVGGYLAYTLIDRFMEGSAVVFWLCVLAAAAGVGFLGALVEILLLRRVYRAPELFQLLATFAVALIIDDVLLIVYGPAELLAPRVPGLRGGIDIVGQRFPLYDLVVIVLAPLALGLLWLLLHRTRWGIFVRAATFDRDMVGVLGVNQAWLFTGIFALGAALAGFGGAVQIARESANLGMGANIIAEAFVVVVIGGMGSLPGALLAAVLIGELHAFGAAFFPQLTLVMTFLVMAVVLAVRPWGLLGKPDRTNRPHEFSREPPLRPLGRSTALLAAAVVAALAVLPAVVGVYGLTVLTDILILVIFACSLHLIMGPGGMISFGHACYFGIGAYAVALAVRYWALPVLPALVLAPLGGGLVALLFGWLCVRLSGVYFAMLTLAFAQIVWSIVFQWYGVTGGDNGIVGIWPSAVTTDKLSFYYIVLAVTAAAVVALAALLHTPFGYTLRACRDAPHRATAIGIDVALHRWLAFGIAGAFGGLAGGLFTLAKGSVFPNAIDVTRSIDGLVMVLLGGVQSIAGPIVGAATFLGLQTEILRHTDHWRIILGGLVLVIVLLFPSGIVGSVMALVRRREAP